MSSLLQNIIGLYLFVVIVRFLCQLLRVDFRNQLVQLVVLLTNPPLRFLRRFIPGLYGIDLTAVVLIWLLGLLKLVVPLTLSGVQLKWSGAFILGAANSLDTIAWVLLTAVLIRAVLSWVAPHSHHPGARLVVELSEPLLAPFRRLLPSLGGLDLSPILVLMSIRFVQQLLLVPLATWGARLL